MRWIQACLLLAVQGRSLPTVRIVGAATDILAGPPFLAGLIGRCGWMAGLAPMTTLFTRQDVVGVQALIQAGWSQVEATGFGRSCLGDSIERSECGFLIAVLGLPGLRVSPGHLESAAVLALIQGQVELFEPLTRAGAGWTRAADLRAARLIRIPGRTLRAAKVCGARFAPEIQRMLEQGVALGDGTD